MGIVQAVPCQSCRYPIADRGAGQPRFFLFRQGCVCHFSGSPRGASPVCPCSAGTTAFGNRTCSQPRQRGCSKGLGRCPNKQKQRFPASPGTAVSSLCGNKGTACYNGDTPQKGGEDRPMRRPTPKLQWEGTGLTRHCLSYPRSFWQTVSRPSHCGVRFAQVEKRTTPHTRVTKQAESLVGSGGRRLKPFLIRETFK